MLEKLILGTVQLGIQYGINNQNGVPSESEAFEILGRSADAGIKTLDTAEAYGNSQQLIGSFLKSHPGTKFEILTKFKANEIPLRSQLEKTLSVLGVNRVRGYSYHQFADLSSSALKQELVSLKAEGTISNIGISIYTNEEFLSAIQAEHIDLIQIPFNLLDNWSQRGALIERALAAGKNVHIRSVFLQGLFYKDPEQLPARLRPLGGLLTELRKLASEYGTGIGSMAMAYVLQFKQIQGVLFGVETRDQLDKNLNGFRTVLPGECIQKISRIQVSTPELLDPRYWQ